MRVSKKTYTKRRKGTKKRKTNTRRKRVRGGDFTTPTKQKQQEIIQPDTPKKEHFFITLRKRYLEELRSKGDAVKETIQPPETPYEYFDEADFDSNEAGESPGYKHGLYDGKHGYEAIDFHYIPMTEKVNDIVINDKYKSDYRDGYEAGKKSKLRTTQVYE